MNNFKCNNAKCGHEFYIVKHSTYYRQNGIEYEENGKKVTCPECGSEHIEYIKTKEGFGIFGKFSSKSPDEKAAFLKKRATDHANSKIEKEKRKHLQRNYAGVLKSGDV